MLWSHSTIERVQLLQPNTTVRKSPSSVEIPASGLNHLSFLSVYSAWRGTTQNPQKAVWNGGNGWTGLVHCVYLGSWTDCWLTTPLNTPGGLTSQRRQNNIYSSKNDFWLFISEVWWGRGGRKKKIDQQTILNVEKLHSRHSWLRSNSTDARIRCSF